MRILIVTPIFPPENRGPATYCFNLCQKIPSKVITFTQNPTAVKNVPVFSIPKSGGTLLRQLRLIGKIWQVGTDCNVIYAQGADVVGLATVVAGKLTGKKVVVKFVGDLDEEMRRDFGKNVPYLKFVIKLVLSLADKVVFPADHLRKQIAAKYKIDPAKTAVIYNAAEMSNFKFLMPKKSLKFSIITPMSQLLPVKNAPGVLRAAALLRDVKVNVVGGGDDKELRKLAKELKIEKRVKFWGSLPNDRARRVLRASDVFVLNSRHEGMPHALIEALADGVPVVATKIPAHLEVLTDKKTGILVNVDDPKDLARGLKEVRDVREQLIKNGQKLYEEKFTWESHLKALRDIFDSTN